MAGCTGRAGWLQAAVLVMAVLPAGTAWTAAREPVEVSATILPARDGEPATPRLGDPLRIRLSTAVDVTLGPPRLLSDGSAVELMEALPERLPAGNVDVFLVPFDVGEMEIVLGVPWETVSGEAGETEVTVSIGVVPTVEDPAAALPADIRGPASILLRRAPFWLLMLAAAVLLVALWSWFRRRRPALAGVATPPPDPFGGLAPSEWALDQLRRLEEERVLERQGIDVYHVRLSAILRRYMEGQFGVDALERTTTEILHEVEERVRPLPGPRTRLRNVLSACDLVKFARFHPASEEALSLLESARRFVDETRPRPPAPPEPEMA